MYCRILEADQDLITEDTIMVPRILLISYTYYVYVCTTPRVTPLIKQGISAFAYVTLKTFPVNMQILAHFRYLNRIA